MKLFTCTNCSQPVFFENSFCLQCNSSLGFETGMLQHFALKPEGNNKFSLIGTGSNNLYSYCANRAHGVCNWLVPQDHSTAFCKACDLNRTIPDITNPEYATRWSKIERAKHRLVYQILRLQLPLVSKMKIPNEGIVFDFKADQLTAGGEKIMTGHDNGTITINIAEADDIERELARRSMNEVYRTILGHFRHEVGHYYFERLIDNTGHINRFRKLFGDERIDYSSSLKNYHANGPLQNWNEKFISAYATAHPWEDWAETWAHYLHIIDTLETAYAFGLSVEPIVDEPGDALVEDVSRDPYTISNFDRILKIWLPLTFALNSLNRSMGLRDTYPFVISSEVSKKMKFIHEVVRECGKKAVSNFHQ